jgi:hypothetical protein
MPEDRLTQRLKAASEAKTADKAAELAAKAEIDAIRATNAAKLARVETEVALEIKTFLSRVHTGLFGNRYWDFGNGVALSHKGHLTWVRVTHSGFESTARSTWHPTSKAPDQPVQHTAESIVNLMAEYLERGDPRER